MEYIDGTDAAELLKADGPLDPALALSLVAGAGTALDYAWRKRITHRDVKPANVLVGVDESDGAPQIESVRLADFGIAKAAGEATSLTSTGMTIGTMQYISPEAIEGEVVDSRSDIYSLGCTAFHLLTGQPPFAGTSIASTMSAHLTKPVPRIAAVNPQLPEAMDAVFERVLSKNPDGRYQSCAEFISALQEAAGGEVRYPASAQTLAAATLRTKGVGDPDEPTKLRESEGAAPQRKSRAVPILAATVAVLAVVVAVLGVYATRGNEDASTTSTPTTTVSTPPLPTTTSSFAPAPPPPVVTTAEITTTMPSDAPTVVTTTVMAAPVPYEGMPCTVPEYGDVSADGSLACSPLTGAWRDLTHLNRPAVQLGTMCTEPGVRARVVQTDGIATCKAGPGGSLAWNW